MGKLVVFNSISLDGYFVDANGDMSWAHSGAEDDEWDEFVAANASGGGQLVFGRITYELMASYWPTAAALQNDAQAEERTRQRRGDHGQRQHRLAADPGTPDRRIPGRGRPHRARRGQDDVRWRRREARPEAHQDTQLRQWERLSALRAGGVRAQPSDLGPFGGGDIADAPPDEVDELTGRRLHPAHAPHTLRPVVTTQRRAVGVWTHWVEERLRKASVRSHARLAAA